MHGVAAPTGETCLPTRPSRPCYAPLPPDASCFSGEMTGAEEPRHPEDAVAVERTAGTNSTAGGANSGRPHTTTPSDAAGSAPPPQTSRAPEAETDSSPTRQWVVVMTPTTNAPADPLLARLLTVPTTLYWAGPDPHRLSSSQGWVWLTGLCSSVACFPTRAAAEAAARAVDVVDTVGGPRWRTASTKLTTPRSPRSPTTPTVALTPPGQPPAVGDHR